MIQNESFQPFGQALLNIEKLQNLCPRETNLLNMKKPFCRTFLITLFYQKYAKI